MVDRPISLPSSPPTLRRPLVLARLPPIFNCDCHWCLLAQDLLSLVQAEGNDTVENYSNPEAPQQLPVLDERLDLEQVFKNFGKLRPDGVLIRSRKESDVFMLSLNIKMPLVYKMHLRYTVVGVLSQSQADNPF
ncbi:hypothetical protein ZIOFF_018415 [Zingiber officinale]|uniref:Uncharacterized protein n=1 Tax=Zingiber officinale TaxID=94328 RepID=A0A8J5H612_ZINOF|nr:hypothetical protein ZIOFF_018415 [Zingiber officinale]